MSSPPTSERPPVYQPYRPPSSSPFSHQQYAAQQAAYNAQLAQLQAAQAAAAQQQGSTKSIAMKRAKMMAMGFMMGAVVGSTVVGLHSLMNRIPLQQALKSASGTGAAFGTIFAVGTFIRPVQ